MVSSPCFRGGACVRCTVHPHGRRRAREVSGRRSRAATLVPPSLAGWGSQCAEDRRQPLGSPPARPMPPGLDVPNRPRIEPGTGSDLLLRESQPEPGGPDPPREAAPFQDEPRSEDRLDRWPPPGQWLALAPFPRRDRLRPAALPLGKGSLRQPQVHPSLAYALPERPGRLRVTPWEHTRSAANKAEIAERQRNGASAAGSDIHAGAASARRPISRSTTRG